MTTVAIIIRKVETGEVRTYLDEYDDDILSGIKYQWREGNYACDCNRELFFERAGGRELMSPNWRNDLICTSGRFAVDSITVVSTGEVVYREVPRSRS